MNIYIYIMYVRQTIVQIRSYDMYIYTYKERERESRCYIICA